MSFYELQAEEDGYCYFMHRDLGEMSAHFHGALEFIFVEQGELQVSIDGEKRMLGAGEGCFVDCFCVHAHSTPKSALAYVMVGDQKYFKKFFHLNNEKVPPRFFRFSDFSLLQNLHEIYEKPYKMRNNRLAVFESAAVIMLTEIAENTAFVEREVDKHSVLVGEVLQYAENHLMGDLSVQTLARNFGYSREHFSRILKLYLSESWGGYVNRLRVRRAYDCLKNDKQSSVLDIAFSCGFNDLNTFYRAYKKEFSEHPRQK